MQLVIKEIEIYKNNKATAKLSLNENFAVVENAHQIKRIINIICGNKNEKLTNGTSFKAKALLDKEYIIKGEYKNDKLTVICTVNNIPVNTEEYYNLLAATPEIDNLTIFKETADYHKRLNKYKESIDNYQTKGLNAFTGGYSLTRSFRGFVHQYLKYFKPIKLFYEKEWVLKPNKKGDFSVFNEKDEILPLSKSEKIVYKYLCYRLIVDFWLRAEKIRNLNFVAKPLLVQTHLNEKLLKEINQVNNLQCQTIVIEK